MTTETPVRYIPPRVNIIENQDAVTIEAELPGVSKENAEIEVRNGTLVLQGRRANGHDKSTFRFRERSDADYFRVFQLGDGVDTNGISARMVDGVLTIHVPKADRLKPRTISVN
jgi:HSP20 family protein